MSLELTVVQKLAVWALPMLFALTVPEMARAFAARRLGDTTAQSMGRLSLNPLTYVDPIGTIAVPAFLIALGGGFIMGWPKMVPVNARNFRKPLRDIALTSAAVPGANLAMAIAWGILLKLTLGGADEGVEFGLRVMALAGISINLVLMLLYLLPIPPLPGGHVLLALLPREAAFRYAKIEPYGFYILMGLIMTGILGKILVIPMFLSQALLFAALGING